MLENESTIQKACFLLTMQLKKRVSDSDHSDTSKITPSSPLPSTSGLQINRPDVAMETATDDDELEDTVPCCFASRLHIQT
ncbi:hypothetical protein DPMN_061619 [Dreissena polymorpha]|uniref:Uncharacterized protein n=1 Tax=Dreissena polymorpha TaxID=45954 RepID=A0A9D4C7C9_DREPO|nr:hypothetical protein DPMN_061619 [Dreissena polymorpha]